MREPMDDSDMATLREEQARAVALSVRMPEGPQPTGVCMHCGAPLPGGRRWCDAECRDEWERGRG